MTDRVSLSARIRQVRAALATMGGTGVESIEERVAASVAHLGLVARLVAPALAAPLVPIALGVTLESAWWQPTVGGPYPLSLTPVAGSPAALVDGPVAQLTDAVREITDVSARVLWGNVASAVNSAAVQAAGARPDLAQAAHRSAENLLRRTPLDAQAAVVGRAFRRQSCCLIYRIAPGPASGRTVCGDCVLRDRG